jgi:cytochrome c oxidase subunit 1/cytochrome c oxidase subunit I+III
MYYWFPKLTGKLYFERPGQISFWIIFVGTNLLFFPMHIVGLLGQPRRVYTYPGEMGWTLSNFLETTGAFVTAAGILLLLGNLVASWFRGAPAGDDPWGGPTLEWSVSSPPPEYNFAVVPTVSSAYPNWDRDDRERDRHKLEEGVLVLDRGHEQPVTTVVDADLEEVARMPHESPWPIALALCAAVVFASLTAAKFELAAALAALAALVLLAWHTQGPEQA